MRTQRQRRASGSAGTRGARIGWFLAGLLFAVSLPAVADEDKASEGKAGPAVRFNCRPEMAMVELT